MSVDLTRYANEEMGDLTVGDEDEYTLELVKFRTDDDGGATLYDKNENPYMMIDIQIVEHPDESGFKDFSHFIGLPNDDDTGKQKRQKLAKIRQLGEAFGIEFFAGPIDPLDYNGKVRCSALVGIQDSDIYGESNYVKQFMVER